jgi:2-oxo-4-hydroxy-4-carboxy-5-ureidoimidazoline decarboxylase
MDRAAFVLAYGDIFEHSPWVAERAYSRRPFADARALHAAFEQVVNEATAEEQLALIRAHPELGARIALTEASAAEQRGAGLKALTAAEFAQFNALNAAYREKFGFPFVICVRGRDKASILAAFGERLAHDPAAERAAALVEISEIAWARLQALENV